MFSGAQNFTVTGQSLKNIINNYTSAPVPSDFRMIPLGDIDLQHEISLAKGTGVVSRRGSSDRRVYSAKIRDKDLTVAMYQGCGAMETWRQDLAKHSSLRHPNILQIYGAATSGGVHATIFHGDLVLLEHRLDLYKDFSCLTAYIRGSCAAANYLDSVAHGPIRPSECTLWIRRSTGRLCVDLVQTGEPQSEFLGYMPEYNICEVPEVTGLLSINPHIMEAAAIHALTLEEYHALCYWYSGDFAWDSFPAGVAISLGAVCSRSPSDHCVEIASLPYDCCDYSNWELLRQPTASDADRERCVENGWERFETHDMVNCRLLSKWGRTDAGHHWLSQANHIFNHCQITSNFNKYVFTNLVSFEIDISEVKTTIPTGFLFVCPPQAFITGRSSFCWPECPAYWSLDPSGVERLTTEQAIELGFPTLKFSTEVSGGYWDDSVYAGLRKFHQAKGFDPYSQDVARHLGCPLYQLSTNAFAPFAHIDDADASSEDDDQDLAMDVDGEEKEEEEDSDEDLSPMDID
ncbi:hypothetical protein C8R47DRAFT_1170730 [Mycena vitilis]|nr:hypothetical protein C8R47DRAFT_1170730 [Mycena vitilis]